MEKSGPYSSSLYIALKTLAIFTVAFFVYFTVMSSLGRAKTVLELRETYSYKPGPKEEFDPAILNDSAYLSLLKEKAFLQSMNLMAATDSIYLAINLSDSTTSIGISGVNVHSAEISWFRTSSMINIGDRSVILNMLSQPLAIDSAVATIRREPLMEKIAPRDTSEYTAEVIIPDTTEVEQVHILLRMTNGTRIIISQDESAGRAEFISRFMFDLKIRLTDFGAALKRVAGFKVPEYHPFIRIKVPRDDARIIYRALPVKGQIAVYT
jgi:hypothetical protein